MDKISSATHLGSGKSANCDVILLTPSGPSVICDGSSGPGGEAVSKLTANEIRSHIDANGQIISRYLSNPSLQGRTEVANLLLQSVRHANTKVFEAKAANKIPAQAFTTADVVLIIGTYAFCAHVGDARLYLRRGDQTLLLTEDHTLEAESKRDNIWTPSKETHRPIPKNYLTRAIGANPTIEVDLLQLELMNGDLIVMCTDGLSDYLQDGDLTKLTDGKDYKGIPQRCIDFANKKGGKDNISVITIKVEANTDIAPAAISVTDKIQTMQQVPLFRYLDYAQINKLLGVATVKTFEAGAVVMRDGSAGEEMMIVLSGTLAVSKNGKTIAKRKRGDILGEMGILKNASRTASVHAEEASSVAIIQKKDLFVFLKNEQQLAIRFQWGIIQELIRKLEGATQELANLKL